MTDKYTADTGLTLDIQTLGWDEIHTDIARFQNLKLSLGMAPSLLVIAVSLAAIYVLRVYREARFE